MPAPLVTKSTLLANLGYIQFDDQNDPNRLERSEALFDNLSEYRRDVISSGRQTVSDGAIRGWIFNDPPSIPKRREALRFLHDYILHSNFNVNKLSELQKSYFEEIIRFFITHGMFDVDEKSLPDGRPIIFEGNTERRIRPQPSAGTRVSNRKLAALAGQYQVIRPYVNQPGRYILEPLSISIDKGDGHASMRMYSHNLPTTMFMYYGDVIVFSKYVFSLIQRQNERRVGDPSVRCVSMHIDLPAVYSKVEPHPCISGIMLRGVKGDKEIQGPVSVPFVAIRAKDDPASLENPEFEPLLTYLQRVCKKSHLMIGDVGPEEDAIFKFCDDLFLRINIKRNSGISITLPPAEIADILVKNAENTDSYWLEWKKSLESYFGLYDRRYGSDGKKDL